MRFMSRAMVVVSDLCKNGLNYIYYSIIIQGGPKDLYYFSRLDDVTIDISISEEAKVSYWIYWTSSGVHTGILFDT